jgi:hypothetical protein
MLWFFRIGTSSCLDHAFRVAPSSPVRLFAPTAEDDVPRDLLFGLQALQNGMVTRDRLVMGFTAWAAAARKPLADLMVEPDALDPSGRELLHHAWAWRCRRARLPRRAALSGRTRPRIRARPTGSANVDAGSAVELSDPCEVTGFSHEVRIRQGRRCWGA